MVGFIESEHGGVVARGGRQRGMESCYLLGTVSVWKDERVLEIDGGGCPYV